MDVATLAIAKKYTDEAIIKAAVGDIDVESYVKEKIDEVLGDASESFDTLSEIETAVNNKVDKVSGKGLSTNDFTNAYKSKVDSALQSYTETDPTVPSWAKAENKPTYTASEVGAVPTTRTVNNKALSTNISLTASDVGAVPTTRTVNGKALSGDITLNAADVRALPDTTTIPTSLAGLTEDSTHRVVTDVEKSAWNAKSNFSGNYNDLTNKPTIPSVAGLATTTYVDEVVANKEFILNSTTEGSTKRFRVTVDDSGVLTAVEVVE